MQVRATKKGYHIGPRNPGELFEVPNGSKASWFEPVERKKTKGEDKEESKPTDGNPLV